MAKSEFSYYKQIKITCLNSFLEFIALVLKVPNFLTCFRYHSVDTIQLRDNLILWKFDSTLHKSFLTGTLFQDFSFLSLQFFPYNFCCSFFTIELEICLHLLEALIQKVIGINKLIIIICWNVFIKCKSARYALH